MNEIISALSKALNVAESELSSALLDGEKIKAGAEKFITEKFAAKLNAIKEEQKAEYETAKQNLVSKTKKETAEEFENHLKSKYDLDKSLIGKDLLSALDAKVKTFQDAKTDPEKIRASETYLNDVSELRKKIEAEQTGKVKEWEEKYNGLKGEISKKETQSAVLGLVNSELDKLQLRDDLPAETLNAMKELVRNTVLQKGSYKVLENGDVIVVDENGTIKKDALGNPVKVLDIVTEATKILPVKASGDKGSPGSGGAGTGGAGTAKYTGQLPKTADEYVKMASEMRTQWSTGKITEEVYKDFKAQAEAAIESK